VYLSHKNRNKDIPMKSLFVGHSYIDISFQTPALPLNDTKIRGGKYALSLGGNSVVGGICSARLGGTPEFLVPLADDELGYLAKELYAKEKVKFFVRPVGRTSLAVILPNGSKRGIMLADDYSYLAPAPEVNISDYTIVHFDGHMPEVTLKLAQEARTYGVTTSLDAGTIRTNTHEVLPYMDVVVASKHFCEQLNLSHDDTLRYLIDKGAKVAAVTLGEQGVRFIEDGKLQSIDSIPVAHVVDSAGAGDTFHGAYVHSVTAHPNWSYRQHFQFARVVSALQIQKLGTVSALPSAVEVEALLKKYPVDKQ